MKKNNFEELTQLEEYASNEEISRIKSELLTSPEVNNSLVGTVVALSKNYAKSVLITNAEMVVDEQGLIMDAFIFAAANYVAQAAINKEFSVLIGSRCYFYAPLKLGDILELEAQALFDESSKKRDVKIVGFVKEIKIFEANIQIVCTEEHIFNLKRPLSASKPAEDASDIGKTNPEAMAAVVAHALNKT